MTQLYQGYGAFPADYGQAGVDAVKVGGATASGVVTGLTVAAGVSATVPVAGWIVAGVLGATAGCVALIGAIAGGKKRKAEAVAAARALGLDAPEKVPGFIARALRWDLGKLKKERSQLERQYQRARRYKSRNLLGRIVGAVVSPATAARSLARLKSKRVLLASLIAYRTGKAKPAMVQPALTDSSPPITTASQSPGGAPPYLLAGVAAVIVVGGILLTPRTSRSRP